jgi:hypothetical protein
MARHELALRGEKGLQNVASRFTYEKVAHALRSAWVEAAWLNTERSRARQVRETELVSSS